MRPRQLRGWAPVFLLAVLAAGCGREQVGIPPTLSAINPSRALQGQTASVVLTGTTFGADAAVNVGGAAIAVTGTTVESSTQIAATFAVAATATPGTANISVSSGGYTTATVPFTIAQPLAVLSTLPANGATGVAVSAAPTPTFNQALACTSLNVATFTVAGPGGAAMAGKTSCAGATPTFTPTLSLAYATTYTATLTTGISDAAGDALAGNYQWTFTTAAGPPPPPAVIFTTPANNAINVPINQALAATFSEAMTPATINATSFLLTGPGGAPVTGAVTYVAAGSIATFTPAATLAGHTTYVATITTAATSPTGGALAAAYGWTFTTGATPDTTPPTVLFTVPAQGTTGVPINQAVSATFSKAMNPATINGLTFTLTAPGGSAVSGAVTYAAAADTATFVPAANLAPNTLYTATVTSGAQDLAGNALGPGGIPNPWTFTTGSAAAVAPVVILTSPVNGATGVPIAQPAIFATFSQAMNCATLTASTFTVASVGGGSGPGAVSGTVTCVGATATFTPSASLTINTTYEATIASGVVNTAGTPLASAYQWVFVTAPNPLAPPAVIFTTPANNATAGPVNQALAATFSEAMTPATINATSFVLAGPGGAAVTGVVTYVAAGSIATFTPGTALAGNTTYVATVTTAATSLAGSALPAAYSWTFTTGATPDTTPPTVLFAVPAQGATGVPINQAVSATFSKAMNPATITGLTFTLTAPGGVSVTGLVTYAAIADTATFTPGATLTPNTLYTATVTSGARDLAGNALGAGGVPNPWTFTTAAAPSVTPPSLVSTTPANGSVNVAVSATPTASFSKAMNPLTITTATFSLAGPGGAMVTGTVAYNAINFVATFTPSSPLAANTTYTATVAAGAADLTGNPLAAGAASNPWTFTTGAAPLAPPAVIFTTPANNAINVPINQALAATFSEAMTPATINATSFLLTGPGGAAVTGAVTYVAASSIATFTPGAALAGNTTYVATVTTAATSLAGSPLASNYSWAFTTGATPDTTPPTVLFAVPAQGATGVPINQAVSATFSKAMNPATINGLTFTLTAPGAVAVTGVVTYAAVADTATFVPSANLTPDTVYTATVTSGAQDLAGNALGAGGVPNPWTFTTGSAAVVAPAVILTSPVNGATGVPVTQPAIFATFSQAMNCASLTTATFTVASVGGGSGPGTVSGTVTCVGATATFTPSADLTFNTTYEATIASGVVNTAGTPLASAYDWVFVTAPSPLVPPAVIFTTPANNATGVPINQALAATFSEAMTPATINATSFLLTGPGGAAVTGAVTYVAGSSIATFTPGAALAGNTTYVATITTAATSLAGSPLASNYSWAFTTGATPDTTPPTVLFAVPAQGATGVPINQAVSATFSKAMNPATITGLTFTLTAPGAVAVTGAVTYAAVADTATFVPAANLLPNTVYTATVTSGAQDLAGNALGAGGVPNPWTFTTGSVAAVAPVVILTSPVNGATGVPIAQPAIFATFSQAMNCASLTASTFTVASVGGGSGPGTVSGTVTCVGATATFTPSADLTFNTTYEATIASGVTDAAGTPLASAYEWVFATAPNPLAPPAVIFTTPANNAINVPINQALAATFSEPMMPTTINATSFVLNGPGGAPVTGAVTYVAAGSIATFTPGAALAGNTTYVATVTTAATNLAGSPLASNYSWAFTTGATPDTTPPTVLFAVPAQGATGVPINQAVSATFSKAMNPATINGLTFTLTAPGAVAVTGVVTYAAVADTATFVPSANLTPDTVYTATVTSGAQDLSGNALGAGGVPNPWTFTTGSAAVVAPVVILTSPVNGATGVPVAQPAIFATFSQAMNCASLTTATFTVASVGGGSGPGTVSGTVTCVGATATFTPSADLTFNTTYEATIASGVVNTAGTPLASAYEWVFATAPNPLVPPTVIFTTPANNATGVPINQALAATFSEPMTPATINATSFVLNGPGGAPVTGAVTYVAAGSIATFTPGAALAGNTTYVATITTAATSLAGSPLASNYSWAFTTGATPDTTPPTVLFAVPAQGATGVPINQAVSATFSEAMNPATITGLTFTLTAPGAVAVTGVVTYAAVADTATFVPAANLTPDTVYTATVTSGAQDLAGNALGAGGVPNPWTFTTGSAAAVAPVVILTSPVNGATGVPIAQPAIFATFSQAMNCATLTASTFTVASVGGGSGPGTVSGTVTCVGATATFTPSADLALNTTYEATIASGVVNTAGTPLASAYDWVFVTAPSPLVPPAVIFTTPANNAINVPINQALAATFSEAMMPATINAASFVLSGPGGAPVTGVVTYVAAGSIATFTPGAALTGNTTYVATITTAATSLAGSPLASNYSWAFTTGATPDTTPPTVLFAVPAQGATGVPINQAVSATFSEAMNPATITGLTFTLTAPGGVSVTGLVTYAAVADTATFTPLADLTSDTLYTATVTSGAQDLSGNPLGTGGIPNPWTFTTAAAPSVTPPSLVSTTPTDGSVNVAVNTAVTASFNKAMNPLTITTATFSLAGPGGAMVTGTVAYNAINFVATFTPSSPLAANTLYTAMVAAGATDLTGNPLAAGLASNPWTFTTGAAPLVPPAVIFTTPANNAIDVPINQALAATFSEAMMPTTINATSFVLNGPGGAPVTGVVTYVAAGSIATFTPGAALAGNTTYVATITTAATSLAGSPLASNYSWAFTTGATPDTTPPTVLFAVPAQGATGVPINQAVSATFSKAMNPATITGLTFTLTAPGAVAVTGAVTYAAVADTATFVPAANLLPDTVYTATVTSGAQDLSGNALGPGGIPNPWTFTTAAGPNLTPPTLIATTPLNGATNVALDAVATASFSEAMNPLTITTATFELSGPGGAVVTGTVTYNALNFMATFTPAGPLSAGTQYTATIAAGAADLSGNLLAAGIAPNPWSFTTAPAPTVLTTNPLNGATGVPVTQPPISATFSQALACASVNSNSLTVTGAGGGTVSGSVTCAGATVTFTPAANLTSNTVYTAVVAAGVSNLEGAGLASPYSWSFTTGFPPMVISTSPSDGATGVPITPLPIAATFNQNLNCGAFTAGELTLAGPGGATVAGQVTCAGATVAITPSSNLAINTLYTATVAAGVTDAAGAALANAYAWSFKTGPGPLVPPAVIATVPLNNATGVPLNTAVTATFNEAMDPTTITNATFLITGPGGVAVAGTVSYLATGSIATFTPTTAFAGLTTYVATITTGAESLAGSAMIGNYVWSFTTGLAPDTTQPTVLFTVPAQGGTDVPINQAISATFTEAMNPATINGLTFTVTAAGGATVAGLVSYAAIADTATFTPSANLAPNTVYTATVTSGAQDLSGNALGAGGVPNPWTFTTAPAPATTKPTIISTNPINNSTGVAVNATVNATFSEAMDPLTITTATVQLDGPGGAVVSGTVSYDAVQFIATFTPSANLAPSTTYTAMVTTGAADLAGNTLGPGIAPNPWSFTTAAAAPVSAVDLGTAAYFAAFGGNAGITNQGISTQISGDIGTTGASTTVTGFHDSVPGCTYIETGSNIGAVNGTIYTAPPNPTAGCTTEGTAATLAVATQAASDIQAAYTATGSAVMTPTVANQASELGGITLPPGVYEAIAGTFSIVNGDLTLDAQGNPNATWVFQAATTLTVGSAAQGPRSVTLINGAQAGNVFWHVGTAATINSVGGGTMVGTILAQSGVTFSTAGLTVLTTLDGRALALAASVTMVNTIINSPIP